MTGAQGTLQGYLGYRKYCTLPRLTDPSHPTPQDGVRNGGMRVSDLPKVPHKQSSRQGKSVAVPIKSEGRRLTNPR
jgi:hypothetical protein